MVIPLQWWWEGKKRGVSPPPGRPKADWAPLGGSEYTK